MDIITEKYFEKFVKSYELSGGISEKNFEKFINYIVLSTKNVNDFNLSCTVVGDGDDCGIDGFSISVNGKFVNTKAELEEVIKLRMELEATLYYIQSKTSEKFEGSEMNTFGNGVRDTLRTPENARKRRNAKIKEKCEMIQMIADNYELFTKGVYGELYYVTTGKWVGDQNLEGDITQIKELLRDASFFKEDVKCYTYGANEIRKIYELTKVQNCADFTLRERIELPYVDDIEESYLGIMPIKEYIGMIVDEERRIKSGVFELNVRDYQGDKENRVNQDIMQTILSEEDRGYFGFFNNGITIVGKKLIKSRGQFNIKDFYIVNGCQTSNVLNEYYDFIDQNMWVSVKIVITNNEKIIQNIVRATNNQTEVETIQFQSFDKYQKLLESYYSAQEFYPLYYERRKGQYNSCEELKISKIITPQIIIRSYASIFQDSPHKASRYYGSLEEEIGKKIFLTDDKPIIYYTVGLMNYLLDNHINNEKLHSNFHKFKYYILGLMARKVLNNDKRPQRNSKKMDEYCSKLIEAVLDEEKFEALLTEAKDVIIKTVPDINNTEKTKVSTLYQVMCMYQDLGVGENTIKIIPEYIAVVKSELKVFEKMSVDGDLRYKFMDKVMDLTRVLNSYNETDLSQKIMGLNFHVDLAIRQNRRELSLDILGLVEADLEVYADILEKSKRYVDIETLKKNYILEKY